MKVKHYFDLLGIAPTKDIKIVKRAYRKKALIYHPDRNSSSGAKMKFIEITEAYDQLLTAIEQAEKLGSSVENAHAQHKRNYRKASTRTAAGATTQKSKEQEEREERFKQARVRYQQMKRREAEEHERYYQSMVTGKNWLIFRIIVVACTLVSFLLLFDTLAFSTSIEYKLVAKSNRQIEFDNITGEKTTPITLEDGKKAWVPIRVMINGKKRGLAIEYTSFFKDIKSIHMWNKNKWESYVPDYSIIKTFPVTPLILLIPVFTFLFKSRAYSFLIFFNFSYYFMPILLFAILYSNDRWYHLIPFILM